MIILLTLVAMSAAGCGSAAEPSAGGDARLLSSRSPSVAPPIPAVVPVDAVIPDDGPDRFAFKPVPTPVEPPTAKPVRPAPTPPPDRPEPGPVPVAAAVSDLGERFGISPENVDVLDARSVTWRDGAVGCPEDGLAYSQAEVPGFLVVLRAGSDSYRYHSAGSNAPFLCETPQSPLEGSA